MITQWLINKILQKEINESQSRLIQKGEEIIKIQRETIDGQQKYIILLKENKELSEDYICLLSSRMEKLEAALVDAKGE